MGKKMLTEPSNFHFEISLSVLNHLGRNLYRNFITVLGEAISNSWDADANNVWITIDKDHSSLIVKDDGEGMTAEDFQEKFLKVGYSKRKDGTYKTSSNRPFIGAKGIGKLALLSCADRVSIITKTAKTDYTGGVIDNSVLDRATKDDLKSYEYLLEQLDSALVSRLTCDHPKGTIIHFSGTKEHIRNSIPHLKKLIAMTFRFSVIGNNFTIHVNDEPVTVKDLKDLAENTEFCWTLNSYKDEFTQTFEVDDSKPTPLTAKLNVEGFLATVEKPKHLKIAGTDERATVDLFVNGRLREKNIIKHIPTQRIIESYLYGQIHFDEMDTNGNDPFTSSREGIVENDENFKSLLRYLKQDVLPHILDEWDKLRLDRDKDGDDEITKRATKKERSIKSAYNEAGKEYAVKKDASTQDQVNKWLIALQPDAYFNISAYIDCFLSENLVRKYIDSQKIELSKKSDKAITKWKKQEKENKKKANISFDIVKDQKDSYYLGMDDMARLIEGTGSNGSDASLIRDAIDYKPIRNVVGHTGLLTDEAKKRLSTVFDNIKGRLKTLLSD